ncbi:unnamed protein product [Gongylonema pulchrum]|uniref:Twin-arginine translocation signal domain-containing protein n=1 Tax=Gongylonema pulchrum TaxID=637853 RepID=A0A183CW39_9BILA|nr:unnamed protein product [Gongylonema pulchrum]
MLLSYSSALRQDQRKFMLQHRTKAALSAAAGAGMLTSGSTRCQSVAVRVGHSSFPNDLNQRMPALAPAKQATPRAPPFTAPLFLGRILGAQESGEKLQLFN